MSDRLVAAIDIGTNSIHMIVVRINPHIPSFSAIATEKDTVRLGERCAQTGRLQESAMLRALQALQRFRDICTSLKVEEMVIVATSAVREAPNGNEFIDQIRNALGLQVEIISGQEEARRIYLGVLSAMELQGQPHVIIDIGGGSTELILGDGHDPQFLSSTKVGAVRLTDLFLPSDPIEARESDRLQGYVRGMMERSTDEINSLLGKNPIKLIGTSGTIEAIVSVIAKEKLGAVPNPLQGYQVSFADVQNLCQRLLKMSLAERTELLKGRRGEIIVAGAVILTETMQLLGAEMLTVCGRSLREGLIVDWMIRHGLIEDRLRYQTSVRDRSILKLARKYHIHEDSAKWIARHALSLFDQSLGVLHNWTQEQREYLWASAMLHNGGHHINHDAHHKHSYYLIRYGELLGYTDSELEIIANLARYHRKSEPKKKHDNFQRLASDEVRLFVRQASSLLRLAVALDRRQISAIREIYLICDLSAGQAELKMIPSTADDPCTLELWSIDYKKVAFEKEFNLTLTPQVCNTHK
jgi:exopolyphosphatase/guanosine-5'-triphosphate,3'-diphosphate pyrophosphatase